MRNPDSTDPDASAIVSELLDQLSTTTAAPLSHGTRRNPPRQMSTVEFTEELLSQVGRNKRP
jgi:hypothetical protein